MFTDFTSQDWYFSQVDQAVGLGLFNGRGSEFDPSENITRGEFAAALANLAGVDTTSYAGESVFSDVNGQWYTGAVNWAYENGYMNGMGDGTFGAAIPLVLLYFLYDKAVQYIVEKFSILQNIIDFLPVGTVYQILLPVGLVMGIGIGFLGSFFTVRKHLKV